MTPKSLPAHELKNVCQPDSLPFKSTAEIEPLDDVIGQPRALHALDLGCEVKGPGFNIFVVGLPDSGRTSLTKNFLTRRAKSDPTPDDWCYVENFTDPLSPQALRFPPGQARTFKGEMEDLLTQSVRGLNDVFESKDYHDEKSHLAEKYRQQQDKAFQTLQKSVEKGGFQLSQTARGFTLQPVIEGEPIPPDKRHTLPEGQRAALKESQVKLERKVQGTLQKIRTLDKEIHQQLKELDQKTAQYVIQPLIAELLEKYQDHPPVADHLSALQDTLIEVVTKRRLGDEKRDLNVENLLTKFGVHVLVDQGDTEGAPVVLESHPTVPNLIGRIDHRVSPQGSYTHFSLIRPGAMHKANGGYLLIPAREILLNRHAWDSLKRALRDKRLRIRPGTPPREGGMTITLDPMPIPLDVKVILLGTPALFQHLRDRDEDFDKLFKVRAEFATEMDRTPENELAYGQFVKTVVDKNDLPPFDSAAVAKIIEYGSRLADDQDKLSTRFGKISNLIRESAFWAGRKGSEKVPRPSVEKAIQMSIFRNNLEEEQIREKITRGTIMISIRGEKVGEINALTVLSEGDYHYGSPVRVSAVSRPGDEGVIAIERQAELSGPIHTKGILILSGFLGERYGQSHTLNLSGSITFEQSYAEVEGDSASAAELFALLSSIADIPLKQGRAITGSINQHGEMQTVGGINEKIEGFFNVCSAKGLTGDQGVIIPQANVDNLMLADEVVRQVKKGKFHIWPTATFDEGTPLLTDLEPGERDERGKYPPGTFNGAVQAALQTYHDIHQASED